jgi:peptidoglycan/LPS O-acetylase OafA/YrhL
MLHRYRNNFDILRLILSLTVVIVHLADLSQIDELKSFSSYFSSVIAVDSFFIVSGFLIFMSFDKSSSLIDYFLKRVRRIFPAYSSVIIISSIFLYFVSTKSFNEYFSLEFIRYVIFNLFTLNFVQPTLSGVFENNHLQAVNGALWTIKIEIMFYILVPLIGYISVKRKKIFIYLIIYIVAILYSLIMIWLFNNTNNEIFLKLEKQIPSQLAFFISGALIYHFYKEFKTKIILIFTISIIVLYIHHNITNIYPLYPISLAVFIISFATQLKYLGNLSKFGDLSFGIYIWHFPIIQIFINYHLFNNLYFGLTIFILILLSIALISWHFIEKPFLI